MPISENRHNGASAAGLLAGLSVLALAGGALADGSTAPRYDIVVPDLSVQLADSGESGESGEAVAASLSVLRRAADDYEKSFDNGRIADAHEHPEGHGFYLAVRDDIDNHADARAAHNPGKLAELMAALDEAGKAWPTGGAVPGLGGDAGIAPSHAMLLPVIWGGSDDLRTRIAAGAGIFRRRHDPAAADRAGRGTRPSGL